MKKSIVFLALLAAAVTSDAQVSLVAHTSVGWTSGSNTLPVTTAPLNTTAATTLIACTSSSGDSYHYSPAVPTDSMNNKWTLVAQQNAAGVMRLAIWKSVAATMSASHTFTFTAASGYKNPSGAILAFSGIASGPDQTTASTNLSTPISFALTPSNNNELIVSCTNILSTFEANPTSPYKKVEYLPEVPNGTTPYSFQLNAAYVVQTTAAASSVTWDNINPKTGKTWGSGSVGLSASFYSTLSPAPLGMARPTEGFAGKSYSYQMTTTGGVAPFTWRITSGALPSGFSFNSNGWITGTSPAATRTTVSFRVADAQSKTVDGTFPFVVAAATPAFAAVTCPIGYTYQSYSCDLSSGTSGGTPPYTYSFDMTNSQRSAIPDGTSFSSAGLLSGTLTGMGDFYPYITVTDNYGNSSPPNGAAKQLIRVIGNAAWAQNVFPQDSIFHHKVSSLPVDRLCADGSTGSNCPISPLGHISSKLKDPTASTIQTTKIWVNYVGANGETDHPQYCCGIPVYKVPYNQPLNPNLFQRSAARGAGYQTYFSDNWFSKYHGQLNYDGCEPSKFPDYWAQDGSRPYDLCTSSSTIPLTAPIEATFTAKADSHVLVYQEAGGGKPARLYELWGTKWQSNTGVDCGLLPCDFSKLSYASATLWPNVSDTSTSPGAYQMPPYSYGTADAAGLPLTPFLLTVDEVIGTGGSPLTPIGVIRHPIRMTLEAHGCPGGGNCLLKRMVWPATRAGGDRASSCTGGYEKGDYTGTACQTGMSACDADYIALQSAPPASCTSPFNSDVGPAWGEMFRIRADVPEPPCMAKNPMSRIIFRALKEYGVIFADIGGTGNLQAVPDDRWYNWQGQKVTDVPLCFNGTTAGVPNVNIGMLEPVNVSSIMADTVSKVANDGHKYQVPWTYRTKGSTLSSVEVTPAAVNLKVAQTQQLKATCVYSDKTALDCTTTATWASGDNKRVTIDSSGLLTAVATGPARITATVSGVTGSASVATVFLAPSATIAEGTDASKNVTVR